MEKITFETLVRYHAGDLSVEEREQVDAALKQDSSLGDMLKEAELIYRGIHRAGEREVEEKVKSFHRRFMSDPENKRLISIVSEEKLQEAPLQHLREDLRRMRFKIGEVKNNDGPDSSSSQTEPGALMHEKSISYESRERISIVKWMAIAASVLSLVAIGVWLFRPSGDMALYAQNYSPEDIMVTEQIELLGIMGMASPDKEQREELRNSLLAYAGEQYEDAAVSLDKYLEQYSQDSIARLYSGLSLLGQKRYSDAIGQFSTLFPNRDVSIRETAAWYASLAYIATGKKKDALSALNIIMQNPSSSYYQSAGQVINSLK